MQKREYKLKFGSCIEICSTRQILKNQIRLRLICKYENS